MLLQDRIVLVTGASRGIGAATARLLAAHGAAVAVNYFQNETAAKAVVDAIEAEGGRALAVQADVRDRSEVEAMVGWISDELGVIDTLVNNASIEFPVVPFMEYPWEAFHDKLVGELGAAFFCCRAVAPAMIERWTGMHHRRLERPVAPPGPRLLRPQHRQIGARRLCPCARRRARPAWHPRQHRFARPDHH